MVYRGHDDGQNRLSCMTQNGSAKPVKGFPNQAPRKPPQIPTRQQQATRTKRNRPFHNYYMQTFLIWLTTLKESTDPTSYNAVFQQQLDMIKDRVPTETYQKLKDLNWGNYIAAQLRKAGFHSDFDDHLQHIVTKLLIEPGQLFRGYNPDRHGPLEKRFGASVRNEIAKLIQKAQNRRKYLPSVPLASFDRAIHQDPSQAFMREEIMAKIRKLGVAVWDCILAGVSPLVLVGRDEFGSPSSYRVKKVKRAVGELVASNFPKSST